MAEDLTRKPLDTWTAEDVQAAAQSGLPTTYRVARTMLEDHDYLQNGELLLLERPATGLRQEQVARLKDVFVPDPLLEEIRENRTNGLLQREPTVAFEPTTPVAETAQEEHDKRVTEIVTTIAAWWDRTKFWDKARTAFGRTSYARRSALRVFVPSVSLTDGVDLEGNPGRGFQALGTLAEALDRIEIEAPLPDTAGLFTLATQRSVAVVVTGDEQHRESELWSVEPDATGTPKTVVRVTGSRKFGDTMAGKPVTTPYDLGGRLPVVQMQSAELVTDPVIRQQSLLNTQSTILECVVEKAGFPERYIANAEPPGIWLPYAPTPESDALDVEKNAAGTIIFWKHRRPWVFGFVRVAELIGIRTTEPTAAGGTREVFGTPSVTRFEPIDPTYIKTAMEITRNRLYHLCRQGHLANDSTGEASGLAYAQARAQFESDLLTLKGGLEGMVRDAIEVVLAYAGLMHAKTKAFLESHRCVVTLHVTSGPVTPAEMQETRANRDARLLSNATAMGRIGIEDIGAEQAAVESDPGNLAAKWTAIADAIAKLTTIDGMTSAGAAALLGLSDEEINIFRTGEPPAPAEASKPAILAA